MKVNCVKKYLLLAMIIIASVSVAQEPSGVISDYIENTSGGKVQITQPEELKERLKPKRQSGINSEDETDAYVGYRVQVFSDNNQRTAKSQAQARKNNISARFPDLKAYLLYKAPSWRVRMGDFKTRGEAEQVMLEIREEFPAYASEITVVVDEINLPEK